MFFWGVITTLLRPARIVDWVGSPSHQIPIVFSCPELMDWGQRILPGASCPGFRSPKQLS